MAGLCAPYQEHLLEFCVFSSNDVVEGKCWYGTEFLSEQLKLIQREVLFVYDLCMYNVCIQYTNIYIYI